MLLHADPTKVVRSPYQMINIDYFPTSVERLYKIGEEGVWNSYQDKAIKVEQGKTIYAKGIDRYGNESRIVSQHLSHVSDAIGAEAYDGDYNTLYYVKGILNSYINVDSSMIGQDVTIKTYFWSTTSSGRGKINFIDKSGVVLKSITINDGATYNGVTTIPVGTNRISFVLNNTSGSYMRIFEIESLS